MTRISLIFAGLIALLVAYAAPAYAGTGSAFSTEANCNTALSAGTARVYEPEMVSSRERVSTPMNGWTAVQGLPQLICVHEKVRVNGQTQFAWVVVPGGVVVQRNGQFADLRCFNEINQISRPQVALRESNVPCPNCQPAPAPTGTFIPAAQPVGTYQPQPQVAMVAPAPSFALPQQTIGLGAFSQPSFAYAAGATYNTNYRSYSYTPTFGGQTNPPSGGGNGFGGQTQPPAGSGNDFGGQTNPPAPIPAPVPGPGAGNFGGYTQVPAPVPGPVFGGSTGYVEGPVTGSGGTLGVPAPVFGGSTSSSTGGTFGGFTNDSNSTVFIPAPGAGNTTTVVVNGGVPAPVFGGSTSSSTGGTFGGTTN